MKNLRKTVLLLMAMSFAMSLTAFNFLADVTYVYDFEWNQDPPSEAEDVNVSAYYITFDHKVNLIKYMKAATIKIYEDSVYLPIIDFYLPRHCTADGTYQQFSNYFGWIKGIKKDNSLVFENDSLLAKLTTTATGEDSFNPDHVETEEYTNEIRVWGVDDFGGIDGYDDNRELKYSRRSVNFNLTDQDITCDYNPDTKLISNVSSGMMFSTGKRTSLYYSIMYGMRESIDRNTLVMPGFIVGQETPNAPSSLPAPEVRFRTDTTSYASHGGGSGETYTSRLDVKLDITTPDGMILNQRNLYIKIFKDGRQLDEYPFVSYGNPFSNADYYFIWHSGAFNSDLSTYSVSCIYRDGDNVVESPMAYIGFASGIHEVRHEPLPTENLLKNGKVFDLTGREVKGDVLAPGVYIKNGRKFAVGR